VVVLEVLEVVVATVVMVIAGRVVGMVTRVEVAAAETETAVDVRGTTPRNLRSSSSTPP
jgi:hypothetical protein